MASLGSAIRKAALRLAVGGILVLPPLGAYAQDSTTEADGPAGALPAARVEMRLTYANDAIIDTTGGEDFGYTSGARLEILWPMEADRAFAIGGPPGARRDPVDARVRQFLAQADGKTRFRMGVAAGQDIFTPKDIAARDAVGRDRPYAGWLYVGLLAELRTRIGFLAAELDAGVTGEDSLAASAQVTAHRSIGSAVPAGWVNQVDDGVGVELTLAGGAYVVDVPAPWSDDPAVRFLDLLFFGETQAGNVRLAQAIGTGPRVGRIVKPEAGRGTGPSPAPGGRRPRLRPLGEERFQLYAYGHVQARWVWHDTLIQGWPGTNPEYGARIEPLVYEVEGGVVFQPVNVLDLAAAFVQVSRETSTGRADRHGHAYGRVTVGLHFD